MVSASQVRTVQEEQSNGNSNGRVGVLKLRPAHNGQQQQSSSSSSSSSPTVPLTDLFERRGILSFETTPAIGTEFPAGQLDLARLVQEESGESEQVLKELASLVSHRGVVFVRKQSNLTPALLNKLVDKIGILSGRPAESNLHIHPLSKEFNEAGELIRGGETIDSHPDAEGRQISFADEKSTFASAGWHSDVSFEPVPSNYSALQLRTIPVHGGGDTMWSSMYSAYDLLSPYMQQFLSGLTATHDADIFREQSARHGFALYTQTRGHPDNHGSNLRAVHPVIRTNPVTGWKAIYVNKTFTKRINELSTDESDLLLKYLFSLVAENFSFQARLKWEKDDLAIWDNRSTQHSGIFDYGTDKRTGDRCVSLGEKPFYDPASVSRKEDLARKA
ncbi:hypothetical protein EMMF5_006062 [Cystobasidiomycetes sp. EMM_F5]